MDGNGRTDSSPAVSTGQACSLVPFSSIIFLVHVDCIRALGRKVFQTGGDESHAAINRHFSSKSKPRHTILGQKPRRLSPIPGRIGQLKDVSGSTSITTGFFTAGSDNCPMSIQCDGSSKIISTGCVGVRQLCNLPLCTECEAKPPEKYGTKSQASAHTRTFHCNDSMSASQFVYRLSNSFLMVA